MKQGPRRVALVWLAALAMIALTARLGFWQLDRAAQKVSLQQARLQQLRAPALSASEIPSTVAQARALEHRAAVVSGRWLATHTTYLDNRPMAGRTGFHVLTPLALDDGRLLLVQRGWWPRDANDRTHIAAPPPAEGTVRVRGRVALSPSRLFELGPEGAGPIRQNLDIDAFARETRLKLLPWVLVQLDDASEPVRDGLLRQWPEPAADVDKHRAYAAQWFALSGLVGGLLLWFQWWRPWRSRVAG